VLEKAASSLGVNLKAEYVNIREHCAWVCGGLKEATDKAKLMIAAAVEKAKSLGKEKVLKIKRKEAILVIGGGPAGIQASLDLASQGFKVYLVESSPTIGGLASLLHRTFSINECNCAICVKSSKPLEVYENPNIELLTYCEISDVKRYPWGFKVKIIKKPKYINYDRCTNCGLCSEKCPQLVPNEWDRGLSKRKAIYIPLPYAIPSRYVIDPNHCLHFTENSCNICEEVCPYDAIDFSQKAEEVEVEVGAIIVATGSEEFNPSTIPKYGYGKYKDIITQLQLERLMDPLGPTGGRLVRVSDGRKPTKIVMIQCVGSRDPDTNPYCSRYCCTEAIKNAILIKTEYIPEAEITILYKDIRTYGRFEELYVQARDELGVKFIKGDVVEVYEDKSGSLLVKYVDSLGKTGTITADLVVLSCALVPRENSKKLAEILDIELDEYGFFKELDEKVSNVETKVPGIFICGTCQGPKNISETLVQASAAATLAALYVTSYLEKKLTPPILDEEFCAKCGLCVISCPYNALTLTEKGPSVDELLCQGCGTCASVCPNNALNIVNNTNELLLRQIKAIIDEAKALRKRVVIALCCEECGHTLMDALGFYREKYASEIIPITVPCLGIISITHILEALNYGAEGVLLVGCPLERCHFELGAKTAKYKVELIRRVFEELGLFPEKVNIVNAPATMAKRFLEVACKIPIKTSSR